MIGESSARPEATGALLLASTKGTLIVRVRPSGMSAVSVAVTLILSPRDRTRSNAASSRPRRNQTTPVEESSVTKALSKSASEPNE